MLSLMRYVRKVNRFFRIIELKIMIDKSKEQIFCLFVCLVIQSIKKLFCFCYTSIWNFSRQFSLSIKKHKKKFGGKPKREQRIFAIILQFWQFHSYTLLIKWNIYVLYYVFFDKGDVDSLTMYDYDHIFLLLFSFWFFPGIVQYFFFSCFNLVWYRNQRLTSMDIHFCFYLNVWSSKWY